MGSLFDWKDYFISWRFVLIIMAFILLLCNDIYSYIKEKKSSAQLNKIENGQESINKKMDLVLKEHVIATEKWKTVDVSSAVPPVISNTVLLLFKSKNGIVAGYVQGGGYEERYPFDTSVNNNIPIAVKIKETRIMYIITSPIDRNLPFEIFVSGYTTNLR